MTEKTANFQIYLPGLLRVLAESMYADAFVGVRELLQNAHDSCVRRRVEAGEADYQPRVDVSVNVSQGVLIIQDNGSGLTETEIEQYLSTIGRSYTQQLGQDLSYALSPNADRLIGQFGMGFLSAFLIASEVTLTTHSFAPGSTTLQWRSSGDIHYTVSPAEARPVGTRIELQLKSSVSALTNRQTLVDTIRRYADFLDVPIYVEWELLPVNAMTPPWEADDPPLAMQRYIASKYHVEHPLSIIRLHDHMLDLGHDTLLIPLEGFLFIPPGTVTSLLEFGDLSIYIRRMFITRGKSELLPLWARFVRGEIESALLQPTASREAIQRDEHFRMVQQAISEQLSAGLQRIAREEPAIWRLIVSAHRDIIIGWAAKDDDFFHIVADIVPFRTSRGMLTLPEYLAFTQNTLYYITHAIESLQDRILSESYGRPVVDASRFAETVFVQKYIAHRQQVIAFPLDRASEKRFPSIANPVFAPLLAFCRQHIFATTYVVKLDVSSLPGVILYPKDAELIRETRDILDVDDFPALFADIIEQFIDDRIGDEALEGTFYLNSTSPLVQHLAQTSDEKTWAAGLRLIFEMARLFNGRLLDSPTVKTMFQASSEAILHLIGGGASG